MQDVAPHLNTRSLTINDKILTWVSYIGASVCIVCLILTVLTNLGIRFVTVNQLTCVVMLIKA